MKIKSIFIIAVFDYINKEFGNIIYKFVKATFVKWLKKACIINSNEDI